MGGGVWATHADRGIQPFPQPHPDPPPHITTCVHPPIQLYFNPPALLFCNPHPLQFRQLSRPPPSAGGREVIEPLPWLNPAVAQQWNTAAIFHLAPRYYCTLKRVDKCGGHQTPQKVAAGNFWCYSQLSIPDLADRIPMFQPTLQLKRMENQ